MTKWNSVISNPMTIETMVNLNPVSKRLPYNTLYGIYSSLYTNLELKTSGSRQVDVGDCWSFTIGSHRILLVVEDRNGTVLL